MDHNKDMILNSFTEEENLNLDKGEGESGRLITIFFGFQDEKLKDIYTMLQETMSTKDIIKEGKEKVENFKNESMEPVTSFCSGNSLEQLFA